MINHNSHCACGGTCIYIIPKTEVDPNTYPCVDPDRLRDRQRILRMDMIETMNDTVSLLGWVCPRCARVWSPYIQTCECNPPVADATEILQSTKKGDADEQGGS